MRLVWGIIIRRTELLGQNLNQLRLLAHKRNNAYPKNIFNFQNYLGRSFSMINDRQKTDPSNTCLFTLFSFRWPLLSPPSASAFFPSSPSSFYTGQYTIISRQETWSCSTRPEEGRATTISSQSSVSSSSSSASATLLNVFWTFSSW